MGKLIDEDIRNWLSQVKTVPLTADDPRHVQFFEPGTTAIDEILSSIRYSEFDAGSVHLLSGPRGSGKSTELLRLQKDLQELGLKAFVVDILDYVNPSSPLDVTQFLLAFGLAFADQVAAIDPKAVEPAKGFLLRFGRLLKRLNVSLDISGFELEASADGVEIGFAGQKAGFDFKRELKGSESFVAELRDRLSFHVGELRAEVADFVRELATAISDRPVVFMLDSMEKFRGTTQNDVEVQASLEALFVHHTDKLPFDRLHVVYTVPPFLRIRNPAFAIHIGVGSIALIAAPKVKDFDGKPVDEIEMSKFRDMLNRRVPMDQLFSDQASVDRLIEMSGGNLRDLLRLANRSIVLSAARQLDAPVGPEVADLAIEALRREYQFTAEDRDFLEKVRRDRGIANMTEEELPRFAKLLDTEVILGHMNGVEWYEVHPLALDKLSSGS